MSPEPDPLPDPGDGPQRSGAGPDVEGADGEQRAPRTVLQSLGAGVREVVIVVGMAMVLSLLVKTFLVQPFHIPSGSMENTLVKDDRVIVSKLTPGPFDLARGDVVVFSDPDGWLGELPEVPRSPVNRLLIFLGLAPDDSNEHLIKRVIGLPGDHVSCCDAEGRVQVNGTSVNEPYIKPGDTPNGGRPPFSVTVPQGRVWVMGDHRSDSADSRLHDDGTGATGSVPIDDVTGRAVAVVWPMDHVTWLTAPERVFGSVPSPGAAASTPASTTTGQSRTSGPP
ncbi:MAG: signal peptidase I [Dermatophilaceae bacterium]